ncbi:hypothetical protein [Corynebacterium sp. SFY-K9]|uniref:hypothetical protein n=1 Tax=Corynebacterium sp. SFY-K9 TaxID=3092263 RepID=UPI00298F1293|nr:hypothetical protein [Corynebacterium sp. SFY-K9]
MMKPALEFRSPEVRVATGDGVVVLSLGDKSIRLSGEDVEALVRVLRAADFLADHGYVSGMNVDSPKTM